LTSLLCGGFSLSQVDSYTRNTNTFYNLSYTSTLALYADIDSEYKTYSFNTEWMSSNTTYKPSGTISKIIFTLNTFRTYTSTISGNNINL